MVAPRSKRYFARFDFAYCERINPESARDSPSGTLRRGAGALCHADNDRVKRVVGSNIGTGDFSHEHPESRPRGRSHG